MCISPSLNADIPQLAAYVLGQGLEGLWSNVHVRTSCCAVQGSCPADSDSFTGFGVRRVVPLSMDMQLKFFALDVFLPSWPCMWEEERIGRMGGSIYLTAKRTWLIDTSRRWRASSFVAELSFCAHKVCRKYTCGLPRLAQTRKDKLTVFR